jgi:hypothetical protein
VFAQAPSRTASNSAERVRGIDIDILGCANGELSIGGVGIFTVDERKLSTGAG